MSLFLLYKYNKERKNAYPHGPVSELELWGLLLIHSSLTENSEPSSTMHLDLKHSFAQFRDTVLCLQLAFFLELYSWSTKAF